VPRIANNRQNDVQPKRKKMVRIRHALFLLALGSICLPLWSAPSAMAHRVTVFAWVEDGMVHAESNLGGGKKAKQAAVEVYDAAGALLLTGKTDNAGNFSFLPPIQSDMTVVLNAGMGHRGEWRLTRNDFTGAIPIPPAPVAKESEPPASKTTDKPTGTNTSGAGPLPADVAIGELIDRKLQPVLDKLTRLEQQNNTPDFQDVVSGFGYIAGIAGVAAYMNSRRKRGKHHDQ
jgi:nickel transport protein